MFSGKTTLIHVSIGLADLAVLSVAGSATIYDRFSDSNKLTSGEWSSAHQGQEPVDHYEFCRRNTSK